jgi:Asp-tRNA(Asn)/Glu-tRNA(Gln) amidotransferase A subunit family amidase
MTSKLAKGGRGVFETPGNELIYMPANQQLSLFKKKQLSPREVLEAQIQRSEAIGSKINAVTYTHFNEARKAAKQSEHRYFKGEALPLDGLTVAIKDQFGKTGWTITSGSQLARSKATSNHPIIDKLLGTGAVLHMQTTAPEFYLLPVTWSKRWGVTRNPWNLQMTPGGSSGGSSAVLAAGMTTLALGSDMGGSLRVPAALTGLYAYHPPYGRNPGTISDALLVHASAGPLARTFRDMVILQNTIAGPIQGFPAIKPVLTLPTRYPSIKGWKIAFTFNQGWAEIDEDVGVNTREAVDVLRRAGAIVHEVDLRLRLRDVDLRRAIEQALFSTSAGGELAELRGNFRRMTSYGVRFAKLAAKMTSKDAKKASDAAERVHNALDERVFKKGYRVLLCPTITTTSVRADYDPTRALLLINGKRVDPYVGLMLTSIFNLLNWMPVITVPSGIGKNRVPTGLQITAGPYDDLSAMSVASAYAQYARALFKAASFPNI